MINVLYSLWKVERLSFNIYRGVEQLAARRAHNPKVVSSSLTPATKSYDKIPQPERLWDLSLYSKMSYFLKIVVKK